MGLSHAAFSDCFSTSREADFAISEPVGLTPGSAGRFPSHFPKSTSFHARAQA
jgi:hypothetical protein